MPSSLLSRVVPVSRTRNCVPDAVILHHVRGALSRNLKELEDEAPPNKRTMVIVGSGPSITEAISLYDDINCSIFALGGAHDWLLKKGVVSHGWINADPLPIVAEYLKTPHKLTTYWLASHSHKFVFDALRDYAVRVWHSNVGAGTERVVAEVRGGGLMVSGGPTGATRAPFLGHALGYRKFVFCGVDGSGGHVTARLREKPAEDVRVGGKTWSVPRNFIQQASALETIIRDFDWDIEVRGDGFMAAVWRESRKRRADQGEHPAQLAPQTA